MTMYHQHRKCWRVKQAAKQSFERGVRALGSCPGLAADIQLTCWGSVVLDSPTPWTQPIRLLCPWDFLGETTGVGCHSSSRGSSQPRDQIRALMFPTLANRFFTTAPPGKPQHTARFGQVTQPLGAMSQYIETLTVLYLMELTSSKMFNSERSMG